MWSHYECHCECHRPAVEGVVRGTQFICPPFYALLDPYGTKGMPLSVKGVTFLIYSVPQKRLRWRIMPSLLVRADPIPPPFPPHHPHPPPTPISQTSHSDGCLQNQNEARQGMQGFICLFITGYLISHWYNKPADSSEICVCHGWQMLRSLLNWCQAGWVGGHTANPSSQSVYLLTSVCIRVDSVCCVSTVVISWEFFVYRVKYTRESLTWHILSSRELNIVA